MSDFLQDLRFGFRRAARQPVVSASIVLTLALGVGANVAIFSVFSAALVRPLPFGEEENLSRVYLVPEASGERISLRPSHFVEVRDHVEAFESVVGQRFMSQALDTDDGPERVVTIGVTAGWTETLRISPDLGRSFAADEETQGSSSGVALLSHGTWQRRYGGREEVLGSIVRLGDRSYTIIGVMPPGMSYPYETEFWIPMLAEGDLGGPWGMNVQARLAPGATLAAARQELRALAGRIELDQGLIFDAIPIREVLVEDNDRPVMALLAAVGFLLLIVCVNIANLLLAQSMSRDREFAIRTSLGAGRLRQLRQLLTESLVLALAGGAVGVVVAWQARNLLVPLLPPRIETVIGQVPLDLRVLAFALAVSIVTGLLFGLAPALRVSQREPNESLQGGLHATRGRKSGWLTHGLIVAEVALCLVLLTGAGLMVRDLGLLQRLDLGYDQESLMTLSLSLSGERYEAGASRLAFLDRAVEGLRGLPGVEEAGSTCIYPSHRGNFLAGIEIEGREPVPGETNLINHRVVTARFLDAMGIPVFEGRGLEETDRLGSLPVAVVSRSLAERYWPGESAVGKRLKNAREGEEMPWLTIVGVVGDIKEFYEEDDTWYLPLAQNADERWTSRATLVVRSETPPATLTPLLRKAIREVDPSLPVFQIEPATAIYADSLNAQTFAARLGAVFAFIGLLVAALGVYGSMAFAVGQRRREIAIRMALGGAPARILRAVLGRGALLVGSGIVLGVLGAVVLTRWIQVFLTEIRAADPATFAGAAALLALVGLAACYLPARRVLRIEPQLELRAE